MVIHYLQHYCSVLGVFVEALYHKDHCVYESLDRGYNMYVILWY